MNSLLFSNIMRFIALVLVQVLICNQLNFLGSINPYIYILFLLLYPIGINRMGFLFIAFSLGMIMDLFLDSGGAHAAASLCIAYLRPIFLKFSFGAAYEYQAIKLNDMDLLPRLSYFVSLIFIHHLILFALIFFDAAKFKMIFYNSFCSGGFTLVFCLLLSAIFTHKKT